MFGGLIAVEPFAIADEEAVARDASMPGYVMKDKYTKWLDGFQSATAQTVA